MLTQLFALVVLAGLTAASLLVCFAKWGWLAAWEVRRPSWLMKRCDFCLGYWISVLLLVLGLALYTRLLALPYAWTLAALPLGLPAAAVCRAVVGAL